jgi:hypothetical protein
MLIGKVLNVSGCACQLVALVFASRIDIKNMEVEKAESELPDDFLLRQYSGAKVGEVVEPYPQEKNLQALVEANSTTRNLVLFRISIGLGLFGTLLVLIANVLSD